MKKLQIVENNRANNWLRFSNYIIDILGFYACILIFGLILGIISELFSLGIDFESFNNVNSLLDRLITFCLLVLYYFAFEALTKGRTLGKLITGTKVVAENGEEPATYNFFIRSISRIVPFDALSFLFAEAGWHDKWAKTRVVKKKTFENDTFLESKIEQIGKT